MRRVRGRWLRGAFALSAAALLVLLAMCTRDEDPEEDPTLPEGDDDTGLDDDQLDDDDDAQGPAPPYVEPPVSPTYLTTARIKGVTAPGATVRVTGGEEPEVREPADAATGAFCFFVRLKEGRTNRLSVTAIDTLDREGEPTVVEVDQEDPGDATNLAEGRPIEASSDGGDGRTADKAVDGDPETEWAAAGGVFDHNPQWLKINLEQPVRFDTVRVLWGSEEYYAVEYGIYVHPDEFVTQDPTQPSWYKVWSTIAGDGGTDEVIFAEPVSARWVGLVLNLSNGGLSHSNDYEISEIEVIGRPTTFPELCE